MPRPRRPTLRTSSRRKNAVAMRTPANLPQARGHGGMTHTNLRQIERARFAVNLGKRILVTVLGVLGGSTAAYTESVTYDFAGIVGCKP